MPLTAPLALVGFALGLQATWQDKIHRLGYKAKKSHIGFACAVVAEKIPAIYANHVTQLKSVWNPSSKAEEPNKATVGFWIPDSFTYKFFEIVLLEQYPMLSEEILMPVDPKGSPQAQGDAKADICRQLEPGKGAQILPHPLCSLEKVQYSPASPILLINSNIYKS